MIMSGLASSGPSTRPRLLQRGAGTAGRELLTRLIEAPGKNSRRSLRAAAPVSFRPGRDRRGSLHHRPLVVAGGKDLKAVLLGALPRGAEAILGQLPRAFGLCASSADRLARHFAVGGERHLVFDVRRRRGEGLTGEEGRLDFVGCKRRGKGGCGDGNDSHAGDEQGAHGGSPWNYVDTTIPQIVASRSNVTASTAGRGREACARPGKF